MRFLSAILTWLSSMSNDEAYLDVTTNKLGIKSAVKVTSSHQYDIWQELHLTCSAGVSLKINSLLNSPLIFISLLGLTVVLPGGSSGLLEKCPLKVSWGR